MPVDYEKYDSIIMFLTQNLEGGIDDIFDLIFYFLCRKSDYFTDTFASRESLLAVYDKYSKYVEKVTFCLHFCGRILKM